MRHLRKYLAAFADPRNALLAAAILAAGGIVAGYVDYMGEADRELALRQGPPALVEIQDFRPGFDAGPADEVRLVAEFDLDSAVTVPVRGSDPARWQLLVPIFPVSDLGAALVARRSGGDDAVLSAQVERRAASGGARRTAIGFAVVPSTGPSAGLPEASALAEEVLGDGRAGTVVAVNGEMIDAGMLTHVADGAFAVQGITLAESFVAVRPFLAGRVAALTAPRPATDRRMLFLTALALVVLAGALQVWKAMRARDAAENDDETDAGDMPQLPLRHPEFAPIPSQREIRAADRIAAEQAVEPHPARVFLGTLASGLWAMIWLAGAAIGRRLRDLRSRRSHPEDEAL